jgi:hypothetical protein
MAAAVYNFFVSETRIYAETDGFSALKPYTFNLKPNRCNLWMVFHHLDIVHFVIIITAFYVQRFNAARLFSESR